MTPEIRKLILIVVLFYLGFLFLGYQVQRSDFGVLFATFAALSLLMFLARKNLKELTPRTILLVGVLFRSSLLLTFPALSDDLFRFVWDGILLSNGENPFLHLPQTLINTPLASELGLDQKLFDSLNSKQYYTVYPPFSQAIYGLSAWLGGGTVYGSMFWLRLFLLGAEIGTMFLMGKLLIHFNKSSLNLILYAWNPLVIIEVIANLHFEGLMLFLLLLSCWLAIRQKWLLSALAMGLSISTKLIPLMLLPMFFHYFGWKRWLSWSVLAGVVACITFLPFASVELFENMFSSVDLYFQSFEFNASIFYLVRAVGFATIGYDIVQTAGPVISIFTFVFLLLLAFAKWKGVQNQFDRMALALTLYLFMATTVHPWYLITICGLAIFTSRSYVFVWSLLVVISYSHYYGGGFQENYLFIGIEYALLLLAIIFDRIISTWIGVKSESNELVT